MKPLHPLSFLLGLASGLAVLAIVTGGMRLLRADSSAARVVSGDIRQERGPNLARAAEQLGMTEEDVRKALADGKTLRDLAAEKGVTLSFGNRVRGSGSLLSSSGASVPTGRE